MGACELYGKIPQQKGSIKNAGNQRQDGIFQNVMETKKATKFWDRMEGLLFNPRTGRASRKSFNWLAGLALLMYTLIRGFALGAWPPDVVFYTLGALIFGTLWLSVTDKHKSDE